MLAVGIVLKMWLRWFLVIPVVAIVYVLVLLVTRSITKQDLHGLRSVFKKSPVV